MKILVIEDEQDLARNVCGLLNDHDYETLQATSEKEADQVLRDHGKEIMIAIIDMKLPAKKGLDVNESGFRIIQFLSKYFPEIISIVYTGYETFENAMKCIENGALYYLVKGGESELLLKVVKRAQSAHQLKAKHEKMQDAISRIWKNMPLILSKLEMADAIFKEIRSSCERIRDEIQNRNDE